MGMWPRLQSSGGHGAAYAFGPEGAASAGRPEDLPISGARAERRALRQRVARQPTNWEGQGNYGLEFSPFLNDLRRLTDLRL